MIENEIVLSDREEEKGKTDLLHKFSVVENFLYVNTFVSLRV